MTTFKPNMDLTTIFKLNKNLDIPKHIGFNIKPTFHRNDMHIFKQDFKGPSQFKDDSKATINSIKNIDQIQKFKSLSNFQYKGSKEITDALELPDIEMKDFNAQYKYRYPQYTTEEYIINQLQTEQGIPNEFNTYMRQDQTGQSIESINQDNNAYQAGLEKLKSQIKERSEKIKAINDDTTLTDIQKGRETLKINMEAIGHKKQIKELSKKNPVLIKPAIQPPAAQPAAKPAAKPAPIINKSLPAAPQPAKPAAKPAAQPAAQPAAPTSPAAQPKAKLTLVSTTPITKIRKGDVVNESKSTGPTKILSIEDQEKLTKLQSLVRQKLARKAVNDKRKSIDTSDEKTVVADTNPQTETYKVNFDSFKKLMETYIKLPDNATIDDLSSEDQIKMKGFKKALGISGQTKLFKTLRKKLL